MDDRPGGDPAPRRYARHVRLAAIGAEGQRRLRAARVAVVGLGALGSVSAPTLARCGVGRLVLVDRDLVEPENLTSQVLYDEADAEAGLPKAVAGARRIAAINREVEVVPRVIDLTARTADEALAGVDLVLDGTDNFETRFLINDHAVRSGTPWIYTGALGHHGHLMAIVPGRTACMRCYVRDVPPPGSFGTCDTEGLLGPLAQVMASLQAVEAIKLLTGQERALFGGLLAVDAWRGEMDRIDVLRAPDCPACGARRFEFLEEGRGTEGVVLCGRDAVQVPGRPGARPSFDALARSLASVGEVRYNEFILRIRTDRYEVSLFADARAIVKGTSDPAVARSLYSRLFGM
jgi:adenylyltransferase/sulfurtransferase